MNLLNRYILVQFGKNILTMMTGFISIYLLIDFFEKIDHFMEKGKSMGLVFKFFMYNIPFILEQMGPVCILLAGVVTLGILNHSNELIALKACGIPLKKITAPIIMAGLAFTMLQLTMSQFLLPITVSQTNEIWNKEVRGRVPLGIYRNGRYYYHGVDGFYSFARPDPHKNKFIFFSYASWDDKYKLNSLIAAQRASWENGIWTLHEGQVQTAVPDNKYLNEVFSRRDFGFPEKPTDFFVSQYRSMELSLTGLYQETLREQSPDEINIARANFYGRISYILLGMPLLLLGLPLLLMVYRKWGHDLSLAVPASCGMAFAWWGIWGTMQSLAKAGYMHPLFAALIVHLLIGSLGLFLLLREDS